jgi:hypothetical protein
MIFVGAIVVKSSPLVAGDEWTPYVSLEKVAIVSRQSGWSPIDEWDNVL